MKTEFIKALNLKKKSDQKNLGFGTYFTDYMFNMDYNLEKGWHNPRIEPYHHFNFDPATMVLHYGQGVFEGLKAYKTSSGKIQLFRPQKNFQRLNSSSCRLCIPEFDEAFALEALKELLKVEKDWVPGEPGTSLYIRPTIIATDPFLGVRASHTYRFFIILSPVGAYYSEGFSAIKIMVSDKYVRAVEGGVGETKTVGNYAASLFAGAEAQKAGYSQVLWLDGIEKKYVEEVGSMNIFFVIDNEIITPMLSGSILPGITRDSIITLAKNSGMSVSERKISIDEVIDAHKSGKLDEVFGTGTAAIVSPVGELKYKDKIININNGKVGQIADKFFNMLLDIQYGKSPDTMNWIEPV